MSLKTISRDTFFILQSECDISEEKKNTIEKLLENYVSATPEILRPEKTYTNTNYKKKKYNKYDKHDKHDNNNSQYQNINKFGKKLNYDRRPKVQKQDVSINNIIQQKLKGFLNKISDDNHKTLNEKICLMYDKDFNRLIIDTIFNVSFNNIHYCNHYINILNSLHKEKNVNYEIFLIKSNEFISDIENFKFETIDSSKYDEFCDMNKQKSLIINKSKMYFETLKHFKKKYYKTKKIKHFNEKYVLDTIVNTLHNVISDSEKELVTTIIYKFFETFDKLQNNYNIKKVIELRTNSTLKLNSKAKFKLMDVEDMIEKTLKEKKNKIKQNKTKNKNE